MKRLVSLLAITGAFLISMLTAVPSYAQATRTWISGVGDDANPCSRTAPCKTFAGAISKTATGGEIDCLDPGGFGAVTVTKSITLDCGGGNGGQNGSILVTGTNGITVNGASVIVKVRNMTINGIQASGSPGLSGIKFVQGRALIVEHVGIFGFGGTGGSNGGIDFEPGSSGAANQTTQLDVLDTEVQYGLADGILIKPQNGATVKATLNRYSGLNNGGGGLRVDMTSDTSGTGVAVTAFHSSFSNNGGSGVLSLSPSADAPSVVTVADSVVAGNPGGVVSNGGNSTINIGGNTVAGNGTGIVKLGSPAGAVKTWSDNHFAGNGSDGTPDTPALTKL